MPCHYWCDSLEESQILIKRICQDLLDEICFATKENTVNRESRIAHMSGKCDKCGEHTLECKCISSLVDHPSHYQSSTMEVIEVIEAFDLGFNLGNAIKYILRAGKKNLLVEDLEKAVWYLKREIESNNKE